MRLRPQHRKDYNVFNINGEEETEPIVLLQVNQESDLKEHNRHYAEYMFLSETLRWKEDLEVDGSKNEFGEQNVKCLTQYHFSPNRWAGRRG